MKKIKLFIIVLSAFYFSNLNAQIMIGPKLGLNLASWSNVTLSNGDKKVPVMGINIGGVCNFSVNKMFSLQPELLYSGKGNNIKNGSYYDKEYINYLEIPILAKVSFGKDDFKGFVNLGPYFGYLMGGKDKWNTPVVMGVGGSGSQSIDFTKTTTDNLDGTSYTEQQNRLDIGLALGAGVIYKLGPGSLMGELRYNVGFSHMTKYGGTLPSGFDKDKNQNRVFAISVGYLFTLGK